MDCMRTFVLKSDANATFSNPNFLTWAVGVQRYWQVITTYPTATFSVQGFKNINIFGVDVIGDFASENPNHGLIEDWRITLLINGQAPIISGSINPVPNGFNINTDSVFLNRYQLSRYKTSVRFDTPIQSAKTIQFQNYSASGHANQSLTDINLNWDLNFVFYYQFEGE